MRACSDHGGLIYTMSGVLLQPGDIGQAGVAITPRPPTQTHSMKEILHRSKEYSLLQFIFFFTPLFLNTSILKKFTFKIFIWFEFEH